MIQTKPFIIEETYSKEQSIVISIVLNSATAMEEMLIISLKDNSFRKIDEIILKNCYKFVRWENG